MCALAERDFEANRHLVVDATSAAVGATYGTVLWELVLILLRRIVHEQCRKRTARAWRCAASSSWPRAVRSPIEFFAVLTRPEEPG